MCERSESVDYILFVSKKEVTDFSKNQKNFVTFQSGWVYQHKKNMNM